MMLVALTVGVIGLAMIAMAVGSIVSGRCLRGSCGGAGVNGPDGDALTCAACPRRAARTVTAPSGRDPR